MVIHSALNQLSQCSEKQGCFLHLSGFIWCRQWAVTVSSSSSFFKALKKNCSFKVFNSFKQTWQQLSNKKCLVFKLTWQNLSIAVNYLFSRSCNGARSCGGISKCCISTCWKIDLTGPVLKIKMVYKANQLFIITEHASGQTNTCFKNVHVNIRSHESWNIYHFTHKTANINMNILICAIFSNDLLFGTSKKNKI